MHVRNVEASERQCKGSMMDVPSYLSLLVEQQRITPLGGFPWLLCVPSSASTLLIE